MNTGQVRQNIAIKSMAVIRLQDRSHDKKILSEETRIFFKGTDSECVLL